MSYAERALVTTLVLLAAAALLGVIWWPKR